MPGPNAWQSIPTTLLDLGQKTQDAEAWAAAQRAKLADTWAQAQRQAIQTMASTWQQGTDSLDHFQSGYQGAPDGATGPTASPGYDDMAGASSGAPPAFGANPQDATSPIDQARNVVGASSSPSPFTQDWPSVTVPSDTPAPQPLPQLLGGDQPLTDIGNQIVQGQRGRMADLDYSQTPTLGTRTDQPAREQAQLGSGFGAGFTKSQTQAQFERAANAAIGASAGIESEGGKLAEAARFFHGEGTTDIGVYPHAGPVVDGRTVRPFTPNQDSIDATLGGTPYKVLPGVREVDASYFDAPPAINARTRDLADQIRRSKEITPLIVAIDDQGPYILEGGHRYDALKILSAKSFPAIVVAEDTARAVPGPFQGFGDQAKRLASDESGMVGKPPDSNEGSVPRNLLSKGIQTVYHETSPGDAVSMATSLPDHQGLYGLNVSPVKDLALGQGGKGAIVEIGNTHQIQARTLTSKPGMDFVNSQLGKPAEMEISNNAPATTIKSITFTPGAVVPKWAPSRLRNMGWTITRDAEGVHAANPAFADATQAAPVASVPEAVTQAAPKIAPKSVPPGWEAKPDGSGIQPIRPAGWQPESGGAGMGGAPPNEPPKPPPGPTGEIPTPENPDARAGNILLRKFVDPEVQQVIADAAAKDPAGMEAARRGVVSDATVQQLADAAGTTVGKVIARWKPGDIANAETITAMRSALQSKADEVTTLAKAAVATPSTANDLSLALAVHEQNAIQAAVSGGTAELGRGLRALRATVQDAVQTGDPEKMQAILKRMGGQEWTADLAKKLSQIDPADAQARYDFLRNAMKPTLKNDLTFLWYNAMLSGPHTVAVKTMSEILSLASSPFERAAAAAADLPLSAMRGTGRERFFGEFNHDIVGMVGGIREGVGKALYTMKNGYSMSDVLNSDYIRPRTSFSPGVERVLGSPSRILAAGVDMMSSIAEAGAINAGAYRQASIEGLKGPALAERMAELRANPTKSLAQYAKDQGAYRVFQTKPAYGSLMQKIGDLRNADWHGIPVARIIVPFYQTPVNLMKQGIERSPMAAFNPAMWTQIIKKDPQAADSVGRWLLGSSIGAAIALEVGVGNITGPAPTNPSEADAWRRQGKIPWAFRVGDKYVAYNKIPYISQSIGQIASIVDSIQKGQDVGSAASQLAFTMGANLIQEPYMQSLANFMAALKDPNRAASQFEQSMASSTVPALARVVAQGMDPVSRQVSTPLEAMQANIPGLSQSLPPRLDAFGQERGRLTSNISPIGVSQATNDPVDAELTKYRVEPGFTGKTMRGIDLTREENAAHQRIAGQLVKQNLTKLVNAPGYQQLSDTAKARALQLAISHAKDTAANQYLAQLIQQQGKQAIIQRIQQKKAQRLPKAA